MNFKPIAFLLLLFTSVQGAVSAEEDPVYTGLFNSRAVSGYDTVAYFIKNQPVKGKKAFTTDYMDAEWRFSTQANLDLFLGNPTKYAPQYGGYCSWAVSQGYTASADPEQWKIVDGKLYLNYNADVKADWEKDIPGFIVKADKNFPTLVDLSDE